MEKREFKDKMYSMLAAMVRAMANPHRLEVIDLLGQGEKTVEEIAVETNMTVANASQHLQVLKAANLFETRREKNFVYYRLAHDEIHKAWQSLRVLGFGRMAEMNKLAADFRHDNYIDKVIHLDELLKRMKAGNVILLDIRPQKEYDMGHIPKALNIPPGELPAKLKKLSKGNEYIAYCRGPFCVFADEAVTMLTKKGYDATRLVEGYPDWKSRGLKVEITQA